MSHINMVATKKVQGVTVTRIRVIPKNKYSKEYLEHKGNMDLGIKPPDGVFDTDSKIVFKSLDQDVTSNK